MKIDKGFYCWSCNNHLGLVRFTCTNCGSSTENPLFRWEIEIPNSLECWTHKSLANLKQIGISDAIYGCEEHEIRISLKSFGNRAVKDGQPS